MRGVDRPEARDVEDAAERAAASPWARRLARLGFASKAVVYAVIAALALAVAANAGGETTDARGALAAISTAPWGRALVGLLSGGLACHALWFALSGIADPGRRRRDAKGIVVRAGRILAAACYLLLAVSAVQLALGAGRAPSGQATARSWTARALGLPGGTVLVLVGGAVAAGVGAYQIRKGWRCRTDAHLRTERMDPALRRWAPRVGCAGLATQGTVFVLAGAFFVQAAVRHDPREATGFDGALRWIASQQPHGTILLTAVGVGLLAFATWSAIEARYRRLPA